MAKKTDVKSFADKTYSQLMSLQPTKDPTTQMPWPSREPADSQKCGGYEICMQVGESHSALHQGTPFTVRRVR